MRVLHLGYQYQNDHQDLARRNMTLSFRVKGAGSYPYHRRDRLFLIFWVLRRFLHRVNYVLFIHRRHVMLRKLHGVERRQGKGGDGGYRNGSGFRRKGSAVIVQLSLRLQTSFPSILQYDFGQYTSTGGARRAF